MEDVGAKKTHCCEKATITHKGAREGAFCYAGTQVTTHSFDSI